MSGSLTPLACPACGGSLDPLPADVVFLCSSCGAASELDGQGQAVRELRIAGSTGEAVCMLLPFWEIGTHITPAFNGSRLLTITSWYSKRAPQLLTRTASRPRGLWGGSIGSRDARRVCALAFAEPREVPKPASPAGGMHFTVSSNGLRTSAILRARAVSSIDTVPLEQPHRPERFDADARASVLGVPFRVDSNRFICALTGLHIYFETLEVGASLLARWARIEGSAG